MIPLRSASKWWVLSRRLLSSIPLRVAYFGSDQFSVHSLKRLHAYQQEHGRIDLHVITRSIKPTGRKLKTLIDLPIGKYCSENKVKISRADSSEEILSLLRSNEFDLSIAVSYGKLVPEKFLSRCKYGGLNVHPSLLPKYSGSSPIQYALMNDDKVTGCTVQTLHPTKFDHGEIILQSKETPILPSDYYVLLVDKLGELGGDLLLKVIQDKMFIKFEPVIPKYGYSLAPRVFKKQAKIVWRKHTTRNIVRLKDALQKIYTHFSIGELMIDEESSQLNLKRVIFWDIQAVTNDKDSYSPGEFFFESDMMIVRTMDGFIAVKSLQLQYEEKVSAAKFFRNIQKDYKRKGVTELKFV